MSAADERLWQLTVSSTALPARLFLDDGALVAETGDADFDAVYRIRAEPRAARAWLDADRRQALLDARAHRFEPRLVRGRLEVRVPGWREPHELRPLLERLLTLHEALAQPELPIGEALARQVRTAPHPRVREHALRALLEEGLDAESVCRDALTDSDLEVRVLARDYLDRPDAPTAGAVTLTGPDAQGALSLAEERPSSTARSRGARVAE